MLWWLVLAAAVAVLGWRFIARGRSTPPQPPQSQLKPGAGRKYPVIRDTPKLASEPAQSARLPPAPKPVVEQVSVVLRRQVPVRFDEPPRSWLGGLPMMPDDVEWPVGPTTDHPDRGQTPLHFVAQIACADLPPELWGGLGPRAGWLLLFLNGQDWDVMENSAAVRVLHIPELGPERAPPPGIQPVHDEMYTGPDYGFVRSQRDIPSTWRRWPVDLVTIPNHRVAGASRLAIIPDNFAGTLYDDAPVNGSRAEPQHRPFTWRGALYVVDSVARVLAKDHKLRLDDVRGKVAAPDWLEQTTALIEADLGKMEGALAKREAADGAAPDAEQAARLASLRRRVDELRGARTLLADSGDTATLLKRIEQGYQDYTAWREGAGQRIAALREEIVSGELDTALSEQDWQALRQALEEDCQPYWILRYGGKDGFAPALIDQSLLDLARDGLRAAQVELAADYYVSAAGRHLLDAEFAARMEPHWRSLYSNRPHRMGGLHDGIQSDPKEGPTKSVLLFQIATDDAMHWVWGDAGAYYVFIDTDRLAAGDFSRLDALFENH